MNSKCTGFDYPGKDKIYHDKVLIYHLNGTLNFARERDKLLFYEFSDEQIRDNWKRKIEIERQLYELSYMGNKKPIDRFDLDANYWFIAYDIEKGLTTECYNGYSYLMPCFATEEAAKAAIDIVGEDELIWLFRDFQPYIGAYKEVE